MGDACRASLGEIIVNLFQRKINKALHIESSVILKQGIEYLPDIEEVAYCIYIPNDNNQNIKTILPVHIFNVRNDNDDDLVNVLIDVLQIYEDEEDIYDLLKISEFYSYCLKSCS